MQEIQAIDTNRSGTWLTASPSGASPAGRWGPPSPGPPVAQQVPGFPPADPLTSLARRLPWEAAFLGLWGELQGC